MDRRRLLFLILLTTPVCAEEHKKLGKKQCAALNRRIRRLDSRLRLGHTAKQGRNLKRRARELQLKRFRQCR